jgi:hypothetical protein
MTAKEYSKKHYPDLPTYQRIAHQAYLDGFKAGEKKDQSAEFEKMKRELAKVTEEKKALEAIMNDPDAFTDYVAGI